MRIIHSIATSLIILLISLSASAQCTPDPVPNATGIYPAILDNGCENQPYSDTTTLVFADTLVSGFLLPFDSVFITGFSNIPAGMTVDCSSPSCASYGSGAANPARECLLFSGTPTSGAVNNVVQVYLTAWTTVPFVGVQSIDDSIQITLSIYSATASTETIVACGSYTWPVDANNYTATGNYTATLPNAAGCDSTITLDLTIFAAPITTVTQVGPLLTADATGVEYQWLDCDNANAVIAGETNQSYSGPNGNYAVQVSQAGGLCPDTSACFNVVVGILENNFGNALTIYPNPTSGNVTIALGDNYTGINVEVTNVIGQVTQTKSFDGLSEISLNLKGDNGHYFVRISTDSGESAYLKILKD